METCETHKTLTIVTLIFQIDFFIGHIQELALSEISDSDAKNVACLHSFILQHIFFTIILLNFVILIVHFAFLYWLKD